MNRNPPELIFFLLCLAWTTHTHTHHNERNTFKIYLYKEIIWRLSRPPRLTFTSSTMYKNIQKALGYERWNVGYEVTVCKYIVSTYILRIFNVPQTERRNERYHPWNPTQWVHRTFVHKFDSKKRADTVGRSQESRRLHWNWNGRYKM
jgi:hypothetical protein